MSSTQFMKKTPLALAFAMALSMTVVAHAADETVENPLKISAGEIKRETSWGYKKEDIEKCGRKCTVRVTPTGEGSTITVSDGATLTILGGTTYSLPDGVSKDKFEKWDSYYKNQWNKDHANAVETTVKGSLKVRGKDSKITNQGDTTIDGNLTLGTETAFENTAGAKLTVNKIDLATGDRTEGIGATVTNKGRMTVNTDLTLGNNTVFQNSGTLTIDGTLGWTEVSNTSTKADEEQKNVWGSIQNTGTIVLSSRTAKLEINDASAQKYVSDEGVLEFGKKPEVSTTSSDAVLKDYLHITGGNLQVGTDPTEERGEGNPKNEKPTAIQMGSVTMWHDKGVIRQDNKGYYEIKRVENKEQTQTLAGEETRKTYEYQYSSYVNFDTISLMGNGSQFVSGAEARETVGNMVLAGSGSSVEINGSSSWGALTFGSTEEGASADAARVVTLNAKQASTFEGEMGRTPTIEEGNHYDRKLSIGEVIMVGNAKALTISEEATTTATEGQDAIIAEADTQLSIGGFSNRTANTLTIEGDFFGVKNGEGAKFDPTKGATDPVLMDRVTVGGSIALSYDFTRNNFKEDGTSTTVSEATAKNSLSLSGFNPYVSYIDEEVKPETKEDAKTYKHVGTVYHAQQFGSLSTNGLAQFALSDDVLTQADPDSQNSDNGRTKVAVSGDVLFGTVNNGLLNAANISLSSIDMAETWVRGYKTVKANAERLPQGSSTEDTPDYTKPPVTRGRCAECDKDFTISGTKVDINNTISNMGVLIREGISFTKPDEDHYVEFDFGEITLPEQPTESARAEGEDKPEEDNKIWEAGDKVYSEAVKATDVTLTITNAQVKALGALRMETGHLNVTGTSVLGVSGVKGAIQGEITVGTGSLLMLGQLTAREYDSLWGFAPRERDGEASQQNTPQNAIFNNQKSNLYIAQGLTFGEGGILTTGTSSTSIDVLENSPVVSLDGVTVLDARTAFFNGNSFFTNSYTPAEEDKPEGTKADTPAKKNGSLTIAGDLYVQNLTWGAYTLQEGFENVDLTGLGDKFANVHFSIAEGWNQSVKPTIDENGKIVVGGTTVAGSGFEHVAATGMLNQIFAGNRKTMDGDKQLVDSFLLQNVITQVGKDYSIADAAKEIDRMTLVGVASGTNAIAFDLSSYTADVIEHHGSTVPHNMGREWIKPIGMSLTQDDMEVSTLKTGYDITAAGFMVGRDFALKSGDMVGIAGSWLGGDADGKGDTTMMENEVKNYGVHFWGAHHYNDDVTILGTVSYIKQTVDAKSNSLGIALAGKQKSQMIAAGVRAEMTYEVGNFKMTPHVGGRVMYHTADEYTIRAQGIDAFKVESDDAMIFEVPLGVTMSTAFEYQRWNVQPYVDMTVRGRFGDTDSTVKVSGVNLGSPSDGRYDITGAYTADLTLGYMSTFKDLNLGMSYGVSAGELGRMNQRIEATLRIDLK